MPIQPVAQNEVIIRRATLADADVIYDFICALEETSIDPLAFHRIYRLNMSFPPVFYFVAELAGEVIGFVSCHTQHLLHHGGKVGEIQELFVRADRRGQGVGQHLIAEVIALAERQHFVNMEVTTNQKRTETVRFYKRASFQLSHHKLVKSISP